MDKLNTSAKGRRLVTSLVNRADAFAFIGSMHPNDHAAVIKGLENAKLKLLRYIAELEAAAHHP